MMVAAVEHDTGVVLGQVEVDSKSNEIPAVRRLSSGLDLTGRIVTMDAMHAQHETARCLLVRCANYVLSAVKDNQESILEDLKAIDFSEAPWHETVDKGHGRIERRRCAAVDLSAAEWDGYANLHGRRQAMRIEREREILKTGKRSIEVTWSLTSLGAEHAGPEELLDLVRNHWHIENRLHYVRDFHLRRRPLPGVRTPCAAQSRLSDQRGHRHRALRRPLPLPARSQPPLCRPRPGGARCDHDRAYLLSLPPASTQNQAHPDAPTGRRGATPPAETENAVRRVRAAPIVIKVNSRSTQVPSRVRNFTQSRRCLPGLKNVPVTGRKRRCKFVIGDGAQPVSVSTLQRCCTGFKSAKSRPKKILEKPPGDGVKSPW